MCIAIAALFFSLAVQAQEKQYRYTKEEVHLHGQQKMAWQTKASPLLHSNDAFFKQAFDIRFNRTPKTIRPDYAHSQLGMLCKQEWKLEKKMGLPVRLRLGSLDYVNTMEGK